MFQLRQEPEWIRFDRFKRISSNVQASKSSQVSERARRDIGEIVVSQFETSQSSQSSESEFIDVSDLTRGQVEDGQRAEGQKRVGGDDRQGVAGQVELGEWGDASKRFGGNEVQVVVFETQDFEIFESDKSWVVNLGDPVPGQVDLPQLRGMREQPLGQRRDLVVPQGEDLESVEANERLVGDVPDLVRVET